ncbi:Uncharacterised protein [Mycobacteroides abscessus subsp. massiliense]|nr:Uncharacterised protein [Mycobacteroides abscessus subsp. massiliense]
MRTSGFTSTRVASSPTNTSQSFWMVTAAESSTSAGSLPFSAISRARAKSTPLTASTGTLASASGFSSAVTSISTPPSTEHIAR